MSDRLLCFQVSGEGCEPEQVSLMFATSSIAAKRRWANRYDWPTIAGISAQRRPEWDHHAATGVPALARIDAGWTYECTGCGTTISEEYIGTRERSGDGVEEWHLDREYGPVIGRPVMAPVEPIIGRPWCHQSCYEDELARAAKLRRYEERVWGWMVRRLLRRLPDAVPLPLPPTCHDSYRWHAVYGSGSGPDRASYVYVQTGKRAYAPVAVARPWASRSGRLVGGYGVCEARVTFDWPGAQYGPATFRAVDERYSGKPRRVELYVANGDRAAFEAWAEDQRQPATEVV